MLLAAPASPSRGGGVGMMTLVREGRPRLALF
jgi:hypothetical protein